MTPEGEEENEVLSPYARCLLLVKKSKYLAQRAFDEAFRTDFLAINCPICTYTLAYHQKMKKDKEESEACPTTCNHLDLFFENNFD